MRRPTQRKGVFFVDLLQLSLLEAKEGENVFDGCINSPCVDTAVQGKQGKNSAAAT